MRITLMTLILTALPVMMPQEIPEAFAGRKVIPSDRVADAVLASKRCSTCHTLKRVTRARYVGDEWEVCVEEMRQKKKSGISKKDAERITAFLAWWTAGDARSGDGDVSVPVPAPAEPQHAVIGTVDLAGDAVLSDPLTIDDLRFRVEQVDASLEAGGTGKVAIRVRVGETPHTTTWISSAEGTTTTGATVRTWRIGPWEFAQVLRVARVTATDADRPAIRFASVVERRNWNHRRIGWQPKGKPAPPVAPRPGPRVCPVGH